MYVYHACIPPRVYTTMHVYLLREGSGELDDSRLDGVGVDDPCPPGVECKRLAAKRTAKLAVELANRRLPASE